MFVLVKNEEAFEKIAVVVSDDAFLGLPFSYLRTGFWEKPDFCEITLPKTNIAPENRPSQKETSIPTIHFQVRTVSFREGTLSQLEVARNSCQIPGRKNRKKNIYIHLFTAKKRTTSTTSSKHHLGTRWYQVTQPCKKQPSLWQQHAAASTHTLHWTPWEFLWLDCVCLSKMNDASFTLPETNSSPLKIGQAPKGNLYSNHQFSGANC